MKSKQFFRNNGLSLVLLAFFLVFLGGQAVAGFLENNADERTHGRLPIRFAEYLQSAHFFEALFENWESEFLQMAAYVMLTVFLFQKGSAESKDPDHTEPVDEEPRRHRGNKRAPSPVRKGGLWLMIYEHSLFLALLALFLTSFSGHLISGHLNYNNERTEHGQSAISILQYLGSARFWFESFQNWQSEFLAVFSIVFLSVWLRERGSPESKPVATPHHKTQG